MAAIRDEQLEAKIQERLERLGISNIPGQEDGTSYLEDVLYLILSDDGID